MTAKLRFVGLAAAVMVVSLVATALAAVPHSGGPTLEPVYSSSASGNATALHQSPGGCDGGAFLSVERLWFRRGDDNSVIADWPADPLPTDFSPGDVVEVREMDLTNTGCDVDGADLIVGVYQDGSGKPGASVDTDVVGTGVSIANGGTTTFNPNWAYTTNGTTDVDTGDDGLVGGGDPPGNQMALIGVVDVSLDPGGGLFDMNECGVSGGVIHNSDLDGIACSTTILQFTIFDPEITVIKHAFRWNKKDPKVFLDGDTVFVNGKFFRDGRDWEQPNKTVHYLYEVLNSGPINGLELVLADDDTCDPIEAVEDEFGNNIGDSGLDGVLDSGETWFFICSMKLEVEDIEDFYVFKNTATFIFEDRNGNEAEASDMFELNVGFACKNKPYTILGTNAGETINGTPNQDVIVARGGDDTIFGNDGNDIICTGNGNDEAHGGNDKDKIFGQGGNDLLFGDVHADRLKGGAGDDELFGGTQPDFLLGGPGFDMADGGGGADTCFAEVQTSC